MVPLIIVLILALVAAVALLISLITGAVLLVAHTRQKQTAKQVNRFRRALTNLLAAVFLSATVVTASQLTASTPKIVDETGITVSDSIAELERVTLNGRTEWISIRGWDRSNPVLLFLAGGPGGTQMAAVRYELGELEKYFVVVNWDQPGAGKSYYAEQTKKITVDTYLQDGYALTEYLKDRFQQEKIYLIGESWGSALGIFLIARNPESYHAFIGTAQMIDFAETERLDYAKAMELAKSRGDERVIQQLVENGPPVYYGNEVTWKSAAYLNYLSTEMARNPEIYNAGYNTFRDMGAREYGVLDQINYARGVINTFNQVYQQLYEIDLRSDYAKLDIPVFFFLGRHDVNAPVELVEEYADLLDAPKKQIVWFEHSGHSPWINERDFFVQDVLTVFLEEGAK